MHLFPIPLEIMHACENINIETLKIVHCHSAALCHIRILIVSLFSQQANFKATILSVFNTFYYSYYITTVLQVFINVVFYS